jgi:tRNA-5-taurinomethyluridine 2-sulfurtransferase
VSKDATRNIVAVSRAYHEPNARRDAFVAGPVSWLSAARPLPGRALVVKVRHGPNTHDCDVLLGSEADAAAWLTTDGSASSAGDVMTLGQQQQQQQGDAQYVRVQLAGNDQGLAAGQFAVFYQDGICLGAAPMLGAPSVA